MIKLRVQIQGVLADALPRTDLALELEAPITVAELEQRLDLPPRIPAFANVNGRKGHPDTVLQDGDRVIFVPIVGGG